MQLVALADILQDARPGFASGKSDPDGVIQVRMNNISVDGAFSLNAVRRVPHADTDLHRFAVASGDILFNATNSPELVGKAALFPGHSEPVVYSNHFLRLRVRRDRADPSYVARWLHFVRHQGIFTNMCKQWVNQATVPTGRLLGMPVPLPLPAEQHRIAAILDQADALRAKRRAALACLDKMARAIFEEMFGDPVENDRGWNTERLGSLLTSIDSGWSPVCLDRPAMDDEWGVLKLGAVTKCIFDAAQQKALPSNMRPRPDLEVRAGDLLFTRKNTYDLVAAVALVHDVRKHLMLPDLIFRLNVDSNKVRSTYLHAFLTQPVARRSIQRLAGGSSGSMPNISKGKLLDVSLIVPPIEKQIAFEAKMALVNKVHAYSIEQMQAADTLFASLQHRAFRGDL